MLRRTLCSLVCAARLLGAAAERLEDSDLARLSAQESADPLRPKVIATAPANGATELEAVTELRIRFDRSMDPLALRIAWDQGGFVSCGNPEYDATLPMAGCACAGAKPPRKDSPIVGSTKMA